MTASRIRSAGTAQATAKAHIGRLSLHNFRNFQRAECEFPPAGVAIIGPNGAGKTNLLEAIYYLEIFRSFRQARDRELVRFGQRVFRVEAEIRGEAAGVESLAAAYDRGGRKKVEVDGEEVERFSDAIGTLGAVVFSLDDVEIIRGSPGGRRRFLNILLSLVEPGYVDALQRYRNFLSQRNEALKGEADPAMIDAWTEGLVEKGARVMEARHRWIRGQADAFARYGEEISGEGPGRMRYDPSVDWPEGMTPGREEAGPGQPDESGADGSAETSDSVADGDGTGRWRSREERRERAERWAERFRRALSENAERERRREVTVVGPHRDDIEFRARVADDEQRDLRKYGSGGQQRTAALALRLVEADTLAGRLGRDPIYLLDDVFAELDRDRSRRVLHLLDEGRSGQVILAAPKAADIELRGGLERWTIRDGRIEPDADGTA
ncbi:MAG: DNA replication and repair protein RecF [Candidatus Palauibacterales bacterium]|nr:DNA replication and repair protein RecF [Candidatus Palauibacterales bacterium]